MQEKLSRRRFVAGTCTAAITALAGCGGGGEDTEDGDTEEENGNEDNETGGLEETDDNETDGLNETDDNETDL